MLKLLIGPSSIVIEDLRLKCNARPRCPLAYFYFDFNNTAKQELASCLASILAQLYAEVPSKPTQLRKLHDHCSQGKHQPSVDELKQLFVLVTEGLDDIFLVLDALDECPKAGERRQLLTVLPEQLSQSRGDIHPMLTSRREPDIEGRCY